MFSKFFHRIKGKAVSTEDSSITIEPRVNNDHAVNEASNIADSTEKDKVVVEVSELEKEEDESVEFEKSNEAEQTEEPEEEETGDLAHTEQTEGPVEEKGTEDLVATEGLEGTVAAKETEDFVDTEQSAESEESQVETMEYEIVEREILPEKMVCPDCGGITLEGLDFCDKCGGEL